MKPALSDKCQNKNKIVLVEDDEIIYFDVEVAEIFDRFFVTVTESLGIKENNDGISSTEGILNPKKATTFMKIPPKILKNNSDIRSEPLQEILNDCIRSCTFPDALKCADVSSLHKQKESTVKKTYRPISVLPVALKVFERFQVKQVEGHIGPHLSTLLCGFRKGYNTQQALVSPWERPKLCIDVGGKVGAVMIDLSSF